LPRMVPHHDAGRHPAGLDDGHAYVVEEDLFSFMTEIEIRKSLRLQYPLSVVTILATPAVGEGSRLGDSLAESMAQAVQRAVRRSDLITRLSGAPGIRLLLVEALLPGADIVLQRIRDLIPQMVRLDVGTACFPATASGAAELLAQADRAARRGEDEAERREMS
jgi:hypothetical protein